jgi:quercetin dioxygenase-like cupin family protein
MEIADRPTTNQGPAEWFTGTVWIDTIRTPTAPARAQVARVRFAPKARTAWHTHPLGQTLHILEGVARVQSEGGPVVELHAGDTVSFAPGERHWHGAASDSFMAHLAVQEVENGSAADWAEHVTDEQYAG